MLGIQRTTTLLLLALVTASSACRSGDQPNATGDMSASGGDAVGEASDPGESDDGADRGTLDSPPDATHGDPVLDPDPMDPDSPDAPDSEDRGGLPDVASDLPPDRSDDVGGDPLTVDAGTADPDLTGSDTGPPDDCPDPDDPWVWYASDDPLECMLIDFGCAGAEHFDSECGCGCLDVTPCGPGLTCTIPTEYCEIAYPGMPGASTSYVCQPSPEACWESPSCDCVMEAVGFGECEQSENGSIVISIYLP